MRENREPLQPTGGWVARASAPARRNSMSVHPRAAELIRILDLTPHPEGGYYREIYRSTAIVSPADGRGPRAGLTTIYFLLPEGTHSRWHRVASDEVWHLYEGGPLELLLLTPDREEMTTLRLEAVGAGAGAPVHAVPATWWQAARPLAAYTLVGCTVGPGFDFADFRMLADDPGQAEAVCRTWPEVAALI